MKLKDRTALVIGGASGLGYASAEACADEGAQVLIADVNDEAAEAAVAGITARGGTASYLHTDVTDEVAVEAAVRTAAERYGGLSILVTSAGAESTDSHADWHFAIEIYLKGTYYACKHALHEMESNGGGSIVTISSIAGVTGSNAPSVERTGYSTAKHGVVGLTRTIALAYAKKNIRANVVCPGYFRTGMTRPLYESADGGAALINETLRVPMGRWGEPREIGAVVAFLASDDASFITGQPIVVDGGFLAR